MTLSKKKYSTVLYAFIIILLCLLLSPKHVFAAELTDLFDTVAFYGSMEVIKKFNWLGKLIQFIISSFSLLGLFLICYQRLITLLYLSGKNTFDNVYDIKEAGKGQAFFGMKPMIGKTWNAEYGTGLDAFVGFGLSLLPNVKAYSDYNPQNMTYNLKEEDTCTTYMLKVAIPTIMLIFFFAIGFNGTLWRAYGNVVDAMATAAENVVDVNLSVIVDRAMNSGSNYKFHFDDDKSEYGKLKQDAAEKAYKLILKETKDLSTDNKMTIGTSVENIIEKEMGNMSSFYSKFEGDDSADSDAKKYSVSTTMNYTSKGYTNDNKRMYDIVIKSSDVGMTGDTKFVHIIISRSIKTDEKDYWAPIGGSSSGDSNNKPSQTQDNTKD